MVKVGDRVQIDEVVSYYYGRCGIVTDDDACETYPYTVKFDDGDDCIFKGSDLIVLSTEEETSMKFKVGDKVKVSDSWEGNSGKVGTITRTDWGMMYKYRVEFEDADPESFKEEELELVKEKGFTKSDLKTGMGVVIDGRKGHVLIGTHSGDVVRFLDNCNYINLSSYREDMTHERNSDCDISEVRQTEFTFMYMTDRVFEEELLFKRNEPKKVTKQELTELLGYEVEVID